MRKASLFPTGMILFLLAQVVISVLAAVFVHFFYGVYVIGNATTRIAVVNVRSLVDQEVAKLAQSALTTVQREQAVSQWAKVLDQTIQLVATQNHLILLPSEAVIAGAEDKTARVQQALPPLSPLPALSALPVLAPMKEMKETQNGVAR